jgi:sterol desaturase/sphingolipid hydroxylase (fatty acid hydroxylase superfamily)
VKTYALWVKIYLTHNQIRRLKMPTPLELLLNPVSIVIFTIYAAMMIWEAAAPARELPVMKNWVLRGMTAFAVFFFLSTYLPLLWDEYLAKFQVFDLSGIGVFWGTILVLFIYEFGLYLWHFAMHKSDMLWKVFHQMHHSAERMDTYGAFYFSPMDMIGFTFLGSLCFTIVAGFDPQAVTLILISTTFFSIFQHANVKTPVWLGYLVQRPESHTVHHAKGVHAYNYSDLPVFDMIFGTFRNPKEYEHETGFYNGASERVADMLIFKDVARPEV